MEIICDTWFDDTSIQLENHERELLWFLTVTCSCCPYLYFGSPIMRVTYFNALFLTFDNEFSGILYSLFGGRQTIFLQYLLLV